MNSKFYLQIFTDLPVFWFTYHAPFSLFFAKENTVCSKAQCMFSKHKIYFCSIYLKVIFYVILTYLQAGFVAPSKIVFFSLAHDWVFFAK